MVLFNYSTRELTAKIVYYGPGICGKTTNLQFIHENLPGEVRGKMLSLATKTDRTLFFDFLPIDLGEIRGMKTRVQLYTVPGQVFYNETRKLVLKGVDGIVFVADSQDTMLGANVESFKNLEENLKAHGMKLADMPHVIQFNKRDLPKLSSIEDLNASLNKYNAPFYESVATTGIGVQDTLKAIVKLVLLNLTRKYESKSEAATAVTPAAPAVKPQPAAAPVMATQREMPSAARTSPEPVPTRSVSAEPAPRRGGKVSRGTPVAPPPPIQAMPPFAEAEIDGLVDEVEEIEAPMPAASAEDGVWMGEPEPTAPLLAELAATPATAAPVEELLETPPTLDAVPQIDRSFDPEWSAPMPTPHYDAPIETAVPIAVEREAIPLSSLAASSQPMTEPRPQADSGVLLTQVASDDDLFTDPSLEVAQLLDGEAREIVVPVLLGEGPATKRFKLSIRLRLTALD